MRYLPTLAFCKSHLLVPAGTHCLAPVSSTPLIEYRLARIRFVRQHLYMAHTLCAAEGCTEEDEPSVRVKYIVPFAFVMSGF